MTAGEADVGPARAGSVAAGSVVSVSPSPAHGFAKAITLPEGLGVEGDAHAGRTVQHPYRVKRDTGAPNLARVRFPHAELFDEMAAHGDALVPDAMGEHVPTRGLDLTNPPTGALFRPGGALVEVSGIRDPFGKIEAAGTGSTERLLGRDAGGRAVRRAGTMGVVRQGGRVGPGDAGHTTLPARPYRRLRVA